VKYVAIACLVLGGLVMLFSRTRNVFMIWWLTRT
jgi:hypothetical protein